MINWIDYKQKIQSFHCKACYEPFISLKLILQDDQFQQSMNLIEDFLSNEKKSMFQILLCESCNILIHTKCRGFEETIIDKTVCIQFGENQEYFLHVGVIKCSGCQFKERKNKEARCFECYNEGGYLTGLVNDNTRDRMVHPICAIFNRRFHIKEPANLGLSLTNKYQRDTISDQKCFKCDKKINYKYKCPDDECLVYMHYYCLMEERTVQILADDDKFSEFLWNFSYSFSSINYKNTNRMPKLNIEESQQLFELEDDPNSIDIQVKEKVIKFKNEYYQKPQINFRCNQHPIIGKQQCICQQRVNESSVICDYCSLWYHAQCFNIDINSDKGYTCQKCTLLMEIQNKKSFEEIENSIDDIINQTYQIYIKFQFSLFDIMRIAEFFFKCFQYKQEPLLLKNGCFFFAVLNQFNWNKGLFQQFFSLNHQHLKTQKIKNFMLEKFMLCIQPKLENFQNLQNNHEGLQKEIQNQVQKYFQSLEKLSTQQKDSSNILFECQNNELYVQFKETLQHLLKNNQIIQSFYKNLLKLKKIMKSTQINDQIDICIQNIKNIIKNKSLDESINPMYEKNPQNIFQILLYCYLQKLIEKNRLVKLDIVKSQGIFDQELKQNFYKESIMILSIKEVDITQTINFYYYFGLLIQNKMRFKDDIEMFLQNYRYLLNEDLYRQVNLHDLPTKSTFLKDCDEFLLQEIQGSPILDLQSLQTYIKNYCTDAKNKKKLNQFVQQKKKIEANILKQLQKYIKSKIELQKDIENQLIQNIQNMKIQSSIIKIAQRILDINNSWELEDKSIITNHLQSFGNGLNLKDFQNTLDFSKYALRDQIVQFIIDKQETLKYKNFQQYYFLEITKKFLQNDKIDSKIYQAFNTFVHFQKIKFLTKLKKDLFQKNVSDISQQNLCKFHQNILQILDLDLNFTKQQLIYFKNINNLCIITKFYIEFYYNNTEPKEPLSLEFAKYIKDIIEKVLYQEEYSLDSKIEIVYQSLSIFIKYSPNNKSYQDNFFLTYEYLKQFPSVNQIKSIIHSDIINYKLFDSFKKTMKKQISKQNDFYKELRFDYEKYCQDNNLNQQNTQTWIQFQNRINNLQKINCLNQQTIYLFLAVQKQFIYQIITQKRQISQDYLQMFNDLYKDRKILPQLNQQIDQFFVKYKKLYQMNKELDIKQIYEIKKLLNDQIFSGYTSQSRQLKFYKNITRLCFDENNKIRLEEYNDKVNKVIEKSKELNIILSKDLWQLLNYPINYYKQIQGNILIYNNEKRYLSQVINKLIDDGIIKQVKYLDNFLQGQKSIHNRILEAQSLENLSFFKFNQELEYISYVPDLLQIAFIIFHIKDVLKRILYNNGKENIISLNDIKSYYNSFVKLLNDFVNYDLFKNSIDEKSNNQENSRKNYQIIIQNLINKLYLQFLIVLIECEKYERREIKELDYLIKQKEQNIKFQIDEQRQLSYVGLDVNIQLLNNIFQQLQYNEQIETDFKKFDAQINRIYSQYKKRYQKCFNNFKDFIVEKNTMQVEEEQKKILNTKNFNVPEEYQEISNLNFDKIKNLILKVQKKVTQKSDRDLIERLEQAIVTNKYSQYSQNNKSIQLKSFLRILKDNIEKEENFTQKDSKKLIQFFKEAQQIDNIIRDLINYTTNVKLVLQQCQDYFKKKQPEEQKDIPNKNLFEKKKKKITLDLPGVKKFKRNSLLDNLLNKNNVKKEKVNIQQPKIVQPITKAPPIQKTIIQQQKEDSDDDSLQELKINKKKIVKKQNNMYQYIDPLILQLKKKHGTEVSLSLDLYTGQSSKYIEYYPTEIFQDLQLRHSPIDELFIKFINKKIKSMSDCFVFYTYIKNDDFWDTYREDQALNFYAKSNNYKIFLTNFRYFLEQQINCFQYLSFVIKEDILNKIGDLKNLFFLICVKPKEEGIQDNFLKLKRIHEQPFSVNKTKEILRQKLEKNPLYDKEYFLKQFQPQEQINFRPDNKPNINPPQIPNQQQQRVNPNFNNQQQQPPQYQFNNQYYQNQAVNFQNQNYQNKLYQQQNFQQQQVQHFGNNFDPNIQQRMNQFQNGQIQGQQPMQNNNPYNTNQRNFMRPPPPPPDRSRKSQYNQFCKFYQIFYKVYFLIKHSIVHMEACFYILMASKKMDQTQTYECITKINLFMTYSTHLQLKFTLKIIQQIQKQVNQLKKIQLIFILKQQNLQRFIQQILFQKKFNQMQVNINFLCVHPPINQLQHIQTQNFQLFIDSAQIIFKIL